MPKTEPQLRAVDRFASLPLVLELALGLRVAAADVVEWYTQRQERLCVFPDTDYYWMLAGAIRHGRPYEIVEWGDIPHFALRTPGYPLFLAACRELFGDRPIAVRLVQALLGVLSVYLVYRLAARVVPARGDDRPRKWSVPLLAAALTAVEPYGVVTSALLLSEALFIPLMLGALWGLSVLWTTSGMAPPRRAWAWALGTGLASGAAVLVRPSWAPFVPAMLAAWFLAIGRGGRVAALRGSALVVLGVVLAMGPWWARNATIYGKFVPTAIWMGASLYDGLNPRATGASDMTFLTDPDLWPLDEETQDAVLRDRAVAFALENPGRASRLALVKLGRYWSPWPNADSFRSSAVALASALVTLPVFGLLALGLWDRRRDPRALMLLAGPLFYFCALHMVFASSMRYRIPAAVPAMALAAAGLDRATRRGRPDDVGLSPN